MDKYNSARNDFEQRMVESATVCGGGTGGLEGGGWHWEHRFVGIGAGGVVAQGGL